ncbi:unnamed protein product [Hydatigera taeniaeformis]|uniref:Uncharacterized protein n=1 Tax=Hydatigena taeniaeformis TaxID=6205 RepID=A0A0R3X718_HYDTA|nr:unnamed protein product [Hydatigera taeniaeformis]
MTAARILEEEGRIESQPMRTRQPDDAGDVRHSKKLRRKSSIKNPSTEESMELDESSEFPSMRELDEVIAEILTPYQQEPLGGANTLLPAKYAWLNQKFVPPSLRGLETISEECSFSIQQRRYRRLLAPPSQRTMATRRTPLQGGLNCRKIMNNCGQSTFWSKRPLPRRLFFGIWDESLFGSDDNVDDSLRKFCDVAARNKALKRAKMLRQVNRRPGEVFQISAETERRFAIFWKEMETNEEDEE